MLTPFPLVPQHARRHGTRACRLVLALVLAFAVVAIGGSGPVLATDASVNVEGGDAGSLKFDPGTVTVAAGSTVTWTNNSTVPITVTSADGLFDSEEIAPGGSFSQTFDSPGRFRYFCVPLPNMKGTVVVTKS